jgi:hypothetical protein
MAKFTHMLPAPFEAAGLSSIGSRLNSRVSSTSHDFINRLALTLWRPETLRSRAYRAEIVSARSVEFARRSNGRSRNSLVITPGCTADHDFAAAERAHNDHKGEECAAATVRHPRQV